MPVPKNQKCPLCDSPLTRERYLQIVGVWEERKKLETALKAKMQGLQEEGVKWRKKLKEMRHAMKRVAKESAARATEKEKKRADRLSAMIQGKTHQVQFLSSKVKELQEQLKRGTTPQVEGLNYERELVKDLQKTFPHDVVEHLANQVTFFSASITKDVKSDVCCSNVN